MPDQQPEQSRSQRDSFAPKQVATLTVMILLTLVVALLFRSRLMEANMYQRDVSSIASLTRLSDQLLRNFELGAAFLGLNADLNASDTSISGTTEIMIFDRFNEWLKKNHPNEANLKASAREAVENWLQENGMPTKEAGGRYLSGKSPNIQTLQNPSQNNMRTDFSVPYVFFEVVDRIQPKPLPLATPGNNRTNQRFDVASLLNESRLSDLIEVARHLTKHKHVSVVTEVFKSSMPELALPVSLPQYSVGGLHHSMMAPAGNDYRAVAIPSVSAADDKSVVVAPINEPKSILNSICLRGDDLEVSLAPGSSKQPSQVKIPVSRKTLDDFSPIQLLNDSVLTSTIASITDSDFKRLDERYAGLTLNQAAEVAATKVSSSFEDVELFGIKISQNWFWIYLGATLSILIGASYWQFQFSHKTDEELDTFLLRRLMQIPAIRFMTWVVVPPFAMLLTCPMTSKTTFFTYSGYFLAAIGLVFLGLFVFRQVGKVTPTP